VPYYIYRVKPFAQLEKLSDFDNFKTASVHAKALRAQEAVDVADKIKIIFADNESQAEDLLCQIRTPGPKGDD
jgi:hypothetical protein